MYRVGGHIGASVGRVEIVKSSREEKRSAARAQELELSLRCAAGELDVREYYLKGSCGAMRSCGLTCGLAICGGVTWVRGIKQCWKYKLWNYMSHVASSICLIA